MNYLELLLGIFEIGIFFKVCFNINGLILEIYYCHVQIYSNLSKEDLHQIPVCLLTVIKLKMLPINA